MFDELIRQQYTYSYLNFEKFVSIVHGKPGSTSAVDLKFIKRRGRLFTIGIRLECHGIIC